MKKRMERWSKGSVLVPHFLIAAAHENPWKVFLPGTSYFKIVLNNTKLVQASNTRSYGNRLFMIVKFRCNLQVFGNLYLRYFC